MLQANASYHVCSTNLRPYDFSFVLKYSFGKSNFHFCSGVSLQVDRYTCVLLWAMPTPRSKQRLVCVCFNCCWNIRNRIKIYLWSNWDHYTFMIAGSICICWCGEDNYLIQRRHLQDLCIPNIGYGDWLHKGACWPCIGMGDQMARHYFGVD